MATSSTFRINTDAEIRREPISEDQHCVIVDDFLQDPHEIVEFAARNAGEFSTPERSAYPGALFGVSDGAMTDIYRFIRSKMTKQFPFLKGGMFLSTFFSMVTMKPEELSPLQRICHSDPSPSADRTIYAALVYLFENEGLGGTGFYRWKERELIKEAEAIGREDSKKGLAFLQENFSTYRKPARYMTESNEIAERLCVIPARFNRMIFYSGEVPHSGDIAAPELLSKNIRQGRLTLNVFANVLPK